MHRTPGLDSLRAAAIAWVMLFHSYLVGGLGEGFSKLEQSGWMGVDLFFVLSGYLIGSQVLKSLAATGRLDFAAFLRATRGAHPAGVPHGACTVRAVAGVAGNAWDATSVAVPYLHLQPAVR